MATGTRTLPERSLEALAAQARAEGRTHLLEPEGYDLLQALGLPVPAWRLVRDAREAAAVDLDAFPGNRIVVKVVSATILHKTEVGGVAIVPKTRAAVVAAVDAMAARIPAAEITGWMLAELVAYDPSLGGELLVGLRWTPDFGVVVTLACGGTRAEALARDLAPGKGVAVFSPALTASERIASILAAKTPTSLATGSHRGQPPRVPAAALEAIVRRLLDAAPRLVPAPFAELEINPLALADSGPMALDVLVRLGTPPEAAEPARPLEKLQHLLSPRTFAVVGVSDGRNPGRIILENTLRAGFDPERLFVVKPGRDLLDGCRCVGDVASLPGTVDLLVLAVSAAQVPGILQTVIEQRKAESVLVIPGGLGEREGTEAAAAAVRRALRASRATPWKGPLVNGGNCLGIRSVPGRYNTLFLPESKVPFPKAGDAKASDSRKSDAQKSGAALPASTHITLKPARPSPIAVLSQSGAFLVAKLSSFQGLDPKYLVSIGNQVDLTVGDYLTHLADDPEIRVFACYVEGFREGDGARWLEAASRIVASGRTVILYRAGRTPTGARASASHTAAVAGDYVVARELAEAAGVLVAEELDDFVDLVRLAARLEGRKRAGRRLGAISNAGFECVAIADNVGPFELASFGDITRERLGAILREAKLDQIVDVHDPLDVTPILGDAAFADAARAVLEDPNVDAGIVGCVPMTPALQTLAKGAGHDEDVAHADSVASRLVRLFGATKKPWVAVVDAGSRYTPFAEALEAGGIPTFRSADRALAMLAKYFAGASAGRPAGGGADARAGAGGGGSGKAGGRTST
ncbi:MAG: acetate--CoA ligase family protein [bacterium]